jgi:hypothetical protein
MTRYRKHMRNEADDVTQPLRDATGTILKTGVAVVGTGVALGSLGVGAGLAGGLIK